MPRTLQVLFRRNPANDRTENDIHFEGYEFRWPDGSLVEVGGFDAFCKVGQKVLGLGRHLAGCGERLVDMILMPVADPEVPISRAPGQRVRRFYLECTGRQGRVHFMDGTPTAIVFDKAYDELRILQWIGLATLKDGERFWFDITARPAAVPTPAGAESPAFAALPAPANR